MDPKEEIKVAVLETQMVALNKSVDILSGKIDALTAKIDDNYTKKEDFNKFYRDEFVPLRDAYNRAVWWLIGVLVTSLGGLILASINYFGARH